VPSDIEIAVRLLVAALLGAVIGIEREAAGQAAGLRTHMTVALGAALFGVVSAYGFTEFVAPRAENNYQMDVTRIASNIVTGVGFLGGGAILKDGPTVRGLTTAASLWVTAAVGLAVSIGSWAAGVAASAILLVALVGLRIPRRWIRRLATTKQTVVIRLGEADDPAAVIGALQAMPGVQIRSLTMRRHNGDGTVIEADLHGNDLERRLAELCRRNDIADVDITS
jgi:putative Mg2+ transporter-C (MgtC) family protein